MMNNNNSNVPTNITLNKSGDLCEMCDEYSPLMHFDTDLFLNLCLECWDSVNFVADDEEDWGYDF